MNYMAFDVTIETARGPINIIFHRCVDSPRVIINYPGAGGSINGYNDKYSKIGKVAALSHLGSFVQMPNLRRSGSYAESLRADLLAVTSFIREHSLELFSHAEPELCLAGISAGGGAVAAVAEEVEAKKILLVAPSSDAGITEIVTGISKYSGELYIAVGDWDSIVSPESSKFLYKQATNASRRELCVIPNCDHQFRGTDNGSILSKAYWWAFAEYETDFPFPGGGLLLY